MREESRDYNDVPISKEEIRVLWSRVKEDLKIAESSEIPKVKFVFSYSVLIKLGILTILNEKKIRYKSGKGFHHKVIRELSRIFNNKDILKIGNKMRLIRNKDLYGIGICIKEDKSKDYLNFVKGIYEIVKIRLNP